jgi:PAS domain S-box-containing protein
MDDQNKTKEQLLLELAALRQQVADLQESEQQYHTLVDAVPMSMWRASADRETVKCNRYWYDFTGQTVEEALGLGWMNALHPEDWARVKQRVNETRASGEPYEVEYRVLRGSDGVYRWHLARGMPVKGSAGQITGWFGSVTDIEDQKRAEAALKKGQDGLEKRVEERTAELSKANRELQQSHDERLQAEQALEREQKTLKHLLRSSDHERQTIAYEIHDGLAQYLAGALMQFEVYDQSKATRPKQAAEAFQAGMTMLRQGHFEARRLISGVRPPILDEEGIVAAVAHLVNEQRLQKGPKIEFRSSVGFGRLPAILENAVYRIAQEALSNACKHSRSKTVRVELLERGEQIRVEVHDHGVGFRPEDVEDSRFGLEGIRERARLLGGTATISSKLGEGTRVAVRLPVVLRQDEDQES